MTSQDTVVDTETIGVITTGITMIIVIVMVAITIKIIITVTVTVKALPY